MLVELGNVAALDTDGGTGPRVTYMSVPDTYTYEVAAVAADLAVDVAKHLAQNPGGQTRLGDQEALLSVNAAWQSHSAHAPAWVWSDNQDFAVLLGAFYGCPVGRPANLEATHFTHAGPPGVGPAPTPEPEDAP